jgi:hypothetical protein
MQVFRQRRHLRLWIMALYALTMLTAGFAHRSLPAGGNGIAAGLAAYALPDGSFPDICTVQDPGQSPAIASGTCDACLLTAAPGLPACGSEPARHVPWTMAAVFAAGDDGRLTSRSILAPQSRGPPLLPLHA